MEFQRKPLGLVSTLIMKTVNALTRKKAKNLAEITRLQTEVNEIDEKIKVEEEPSAALKLANKVCNDLPATTEAGKQRNFCVIKNRINSLGIDKLEDFEKIPLAMILLAPRVSDAVLAGLILTLRREHGIAFSNLMSYQKELGIVNGETYDTYVEAYENILKARDYASTYQWVAMARNILCTHVSDEVKDVVRARYGLSV